MIVRAQTSEDRHTLLAYLASKVGSSPMALVGTMPFEILAATKGDRPVGVLLYTNLRSTSCEFSVAGEPGWVTKSTLREMFDYPFNQLGVYTILGLIRRGNTKSRKFGKDLGFVEKCVIEGGKLPADDMILYAMTRPQCHWLEKTSAQSNVVQFKQGVSVRG